MKKIKLVLMVIMTGLLMILGIDRATAYTIIQNPIPYPLNQHHKELTVTLAPGEIAYFDFPVQNRPIHVDVAAPSDYADPDGATGSFVVFDGSYVDRFGNIIPTTTISDGHPTNAYHTHCWDFGVESSSVHPGTGEKFFVCSGVEYDGWFLGVGVKDETAPDHPRTFFIKNNTNDPTINFPYGPITMNVHLTVWY